MTDYRRLGRGVLPGFSGHALDHLAFYLKSFTSIIGLHVYRGLRVGVMSDQPDFNVEQFELIPIGLANGPKDKKQPGGLIMGFHIDQQMLGQLVVAPRPLVDLMQGDAFRYFADRMKS